MKEKIVSIRLSEAEYQRAALQAIAANKKISQLFREAVNDTEIQFNDAKDFASLIASLNWIGNNINQIAKVLNTANKQGALNDVDYDDINNNLLIIMHSIKEVIKC